MYPYHFFHRVKTKVDRVFFKNKIRCAIPIENFLFDRTSLDSLACRMPRTDGHGSCNLYLGNYLIKRQNLVIKLQINL